MGRFVGIGVGSCDEDRHPALAHAVTDVESFRALLGDGFVGEPISDPDETAARLGFRALKGASSSTPAPRSTGGTTVTTIQDLPPGAYSIDVTGLQPSSPLAPVTSDVLIWE